MNPSSKPRCNHGNSMKKSKSFHKSMVDISNSDEENQPLNSPVSTSFVTKPFSSKRSNETTNKQFKCRSEFVLDDDEETVSTPFVYRLKEGTLKSIDLDWFANKGGIDISTSQCTSTTTNSSASNLEGSVSEYELSSINGSIDSADELDEPYPSSASSSRFSFSKDCHFPLDNISSRRFVAIKKWASENTIGVNEVCQTICFNTACKQHSK